MGCRKGPKTAPLRILCDALETSLEAKNFKHDMLIARLDVDVVLTFTKVRELTCYCAFICRRKRMKHLIELCVVNGHILGTILTDDTNCFEFRR